jgi:hypothetical protein
MAAARRKTDEDDMAALIAEAARRAVQEGGGDPRSATDILEAAVRKDQRLRDAIMAPLVRQACYTVVGAEIRRTRSTVWNSTPKERVERLGQSQTQRVIQLAAGTLLMFPLPGGVKLGEATRVQLTEAAAFYGRQASDMSAKARWLRLVADRVPEGKTAGQVLDDEQLRQLQAEACDHV